MRRPVLTLALASLCGLAVASAVSHQDPAAASLQAESGTEFAVAALAPDAGIDPAIAAAVASAVGRQFSGHAAEVELQSVALEPASLRDRSVEGYGRVRLGASGYLIPFRFEAIYDTDTAAVSPPRLALGESDGGQEVAAGSDLAASLGGRVDRDLREEFSQQPFELMIDRVVTQPAGDGIVHVRGSGTVDFGAEGSTQTRIDALYDAADGRWLRVSYELGGDEDWNVAQADAVAANY